MGYGFVFRIVTENREYATLEKLKDNNLKYVITANYLLLKQNGIKCVNLILFLSGGEEFIQSSLCKVYKFSDFILSRQKN